MPIFIILGFSFMFGLAIGSFLNVCIYRVPSNQSIVNPPSHCPVCKTPIRWYHNIPVLSFIFLRGKCAYCGQKIPAKYPLIELANGLLYVLAVLQFDLTPYTFIMCIFFSALLVIMGIDYEYLIIPNGITYTGIIAGVVLAATGFLPIGILNSLVGVLVGGGIILVIFFGYYFATGKEGMGIGDAKYLAMVGAFLGWKMTILVLILGAFLGTLFSLPGLFSQSLRAKSEIPFGPYLVVATYMAAFYGERFFRWYFFQF